MDIGFNTNKLKINSQNPPEDYSPAVKQVKV
jgi:hypothetical protein